MSKEEIFHNKLVHYNPIHFPNGMKKCFYNAMQQYADQQTKALTDEIEKLQSRISELEKANDSLKEAFKRGSELNDKLKFD